MKFSALRCAVPLLIAAFCCVQTPRAAGAERTWVVILVGLGGEPEYDKKYRDVADAWEKWFTGELKIPAAQLLRPQSPLSAAVIEKTIAEVAAQATPEDSFWLLTLGHGDHDGRRARFHVLGRDPTEEDWPRWLANVKCSEQVIWLTHSSSGWLVKPLSKPGRVVIAATQAEAEVNATEFPYALAQVMAAPAKNCDADSDGKVSLAELFVHVVAVTNERFVADKRIPTEHAQLDDSGDGRGSETLAPTDAKDNNTDGVLSRTIFLGWMVK